MRYLSILLILALTGCTAIQARDQALDWADFAVRKVDRHLTTREQMNIEELRLGQEMCAILAAEARSLSIRATSPEALRTSLIALASGDNEGALDALESEEITTEQVQEAFTAAKQCYVEQRPSVTGLLDTIRDVKQAIRELRADDGR